MTRSCFHAGLIAAVLLGASIPCPAATLVINEFLAVNNTGLQDENGDRSDWIEIHNAATQIVNLSGWCLTDRASNPDQWRFPATNLAAGAYLVVFASGKNRAQTGATLHTNFRLDGDGEYLGLVRPDGTTVEDAFNPVYPAQSADVSFGRTASLPEGIGFFSTPTPRATNSPAALAKVSDTTFSVDRGYFTNAFSVAITSATAAAQIRYTLDGSAPTTNSALYGAPVAITRTTMLRARAYKAGHLPTDIDTQTYLFLQDVVSQPAAPAGYPATWRSHPADYAMEDNTNDLKLVAAGTNAATTVEQAKALVKQSLEGLPSVSLVMSAGDWFDFNTGIYANAQSEGPSWRRACSIEYLPIGEEPGFQANAGVEMHGGTARFPDIAPKHNMEVTFKNDYGDAVLQYPLFTNAPVETFNTLVFVADVRDCWTSPGDYGGVSNPRSQSSYIRNSWLIESQRDMGVPTPGRRFVHLYLNGMYWGVYVMFERPDNFFASTRLGGDNALYDTIKNVFPAVALEGSTAKWNELKTLALAGLGSNASYQYIQGNAPDGTRMATNEILCDIESLMAFMLPGQYAAPYDWPGNWYANRLRGAQSLGFHFSNWDADLSFVLNGVNDDRVTYQGGSNYDDTCAAIDKACRNNAEYRLRVADFVHRHFFHGGALSAAEAVNRWMRLAAEIRPAMIAEAARWGDYRRDVHQYQTGPYMLMTPSQHWEPTIQAMAQGHVGARLPVVLQQLRTHGLYPNVVAPEFLVNGVPQYGGAFTDGAVLTMAASNTIYFTEDGSDPRQYGTGAAVGTLYAGGMPLTRGVEIKARARAGTNWSALATAVFAPSAPSTLRLTELMVDPREAPGQTNWTADAFEYMEFQNQGSATVGLAGLRVTAGADFDFTRGTVKTLAPAQFVLVVANRAAFLSRYPHVPTNRIAGEFTRSFGLPHPVLRNAGELLRVEDVQGSNMVRAAYRDSRGWPLAAAGAGHALVPLPGLDQTHDLDYGGNWRASTYRDGSPGTEDPVLPPGVVINEFGAHTDYTNGAPWQDSNDWIELHNRGTGAVTLANWYLSDSAGNLTKWAIPGGNVLGPGGWMFFDEVSGFHATTNAGFGLSKDGDEIFLSHLPGGAADRVVDAVRFKGQDNGASEGRWPDGDGWWRTLLTPTPGAQNHAPPPRLTITEFMPHPPELTNGGDNVAHEFVEIYNPLPAPVALTNVDGAWRLDGDVAYAFPAGTTLPAGGRLLVVGFDPVSNAVALNGFCSQYGITPGAVPMRGPWEGKLDNGAGRVALERPQAGDLPGDPPIRIIEDEAIFFDRSPWSALADGTGRSFQRIDAINSGNAPESWFVPLLPTPGAASAPLTLAQPPIGTVCFAGNVVQLAAITDPAQLQAPVGGVTFMQGTNILAVDGTPPYEAAFVVPAPGIHVLHAELAHGGGVAASAPVAVTALALGVLSVLETNDSVAVVSGSVTGAAAASVSLFWGQSDGGTNLAAWEGSVDVGMVSNASFVGQAAVLLPDTTYHVRARAQRGGREAWSPVSQAFTTRSLSTWPWQFPVTVSGYAGSEPLRNFPVLVALGAHVPGFAYGAVGDHWGSLRFRDAAGASLPYDVDLWNTGGVSYVWVSVPVLTNGARITALYGGSVTAAPPGVLTGEAWSEGFEAVWHLGGDMADATRHGYTLVNTGATAAVGCVGDAFNFDGGDDCLQAPLPAAWYGQAINALTMSVWVNPSVVSNMTAFGTSSNAPALRLAASNDRFRSWRFDVNEKQKNGHAYDTGLWQYFSLVLSNGVAYGGFNDTPLVLLDAVPAFVPGATPWIGASGGGRDFFKGRIDEVRVSGRARSSDWLRAEYRTVADPFTFMSFGMVRAQANADEDGDGLPDDWERGSFGTTNAAAGGAGDDWDDDGASNQEEYTAGTDPTNRFSVFLVRLDASNGMGRVVLDTIATGGAGYDGLVRYYDLLTATGLIGGAGVWGPVAGMTNVVGDDTARTYVTNAAPPSFYSGRVWLQ